MSKQEIAQNILYKGKPISLDKFEWDETTNTFSSNEKDLIINFLDLDHFVIMTEGQRLELK